MSKSGPRVLQIALDLLKRRKTTIFQLSMCTIIRYGVCQWRITTNFSKFKVSSFDFVWPKSCHLSTEITGFVIDITELDRCSLYRLSSNCRLKIKEENVRHITLKAFDTSWSALSVITGHQHCWAEDYFYLLLTICFSVIQSNVIILRARQGGVITNKIIIFTASHTERLWWVL